jgi:putative ABC transport system ATP-binding protein
VGELVAAVGLAQFLLGPLSLFAWVNAEVAQARASADRIAAVLSAPMAVGSGRAGLPGPVRGGIRLRGIRDAALDGIDIDVAPGEFVGIAAADPASAVTLATLLGRSRDPAGGTVELDGHPLSTLDPQVVRAAVLVAAHDADLFEGRLIDNIGAETTTGERVRAALAASTVDELARDLPDGVEAVLSERARSLSGGQRQRVALARALAADAPVLVLHDPTTAVDAVTELRIAAGVRDVRRERTTIALTTSPALLGVADRVLFVDDGAVRASGTHASLSADHPGYRSTVLA